MARGNKGFADLVAGGGDNGRPASARLPPRTGILGGRENRLAELASGGVVTRVQELVDPARCRIWEGHNRNYAGLSEQNCADLIESFRAQGRQEVAAIVRRVQGSGGHDFEVICGARRHWTVTWLRSHDHPDFRFLIEPRELTDEEAFRLADLENRHRKDLSDYERATDYARAIEKYYGGSQQRMVERLEVSKSWLSRYLELARLPSEVVAAFGSPHVIGISHAAVVAPKLRVPKSRERVIAAAGDLAAEQLKLIEKGEPAISAASVVRRLVATGSRATARTKQMEVVANDSGATIIKGERVRGGALLVTVPDVQTVPRGRLIAAFEELLDRIGSSEAQKGVSDR
jgi:ParB family transcriptional regulator, chromosome partitioning protein